MIFECPRCHYSTNHRSHFKSHIEKKNICPAKFADVSLDGLLKKKESEHMCPECDKCFSHKTSLTRHMKCHVIATTTTQTNSHNTTQNNSHNTNNTSNNITQSHNANSFNTTLNVQTLNVFGEEDLSHIVDELLTRRLKALLSPDGLSALVKDIHFNNRVPENKNVKLVREHHPALMKVWKKNATSDTESWVEMPARDVIDMLIQSKKELLIQHNNKIIRIAQEEIDTIDDEKEQETAQGELRDTVDLRNSKFQGLSQKEKGKYAPVAHQVLSVARQDKKMF